MERERLAADAVDSLWAGVAIVDTRGVITWANAAWERRGGGDALLAGTAVGTDLFELCRVDPSGLAQALSAGMRAVAAGGTRYVEVSLDPADEDGGHIAISRLRGGGGVVLALLPAARLMVTPQLRVVASRAPQRLTPREVEVLTAMAHGLDNATIAAQLGIEYSTVRGHVQSVLEKLGARSRIDAVSRAFRLGLVHLEGMAG